MTYAISDLHGRYDLYAALLKKIRFCEEDTLYILGDSIDRGPDGIKILFDTAARRNVVHLLGNHEDMALPLFRREALPEIFPNEIGPAYYAMLRENGSEPTQKALRALGKRKKRELLSYAGAMPVRLEITVGGARFHLSHTLPPYSRWKDPAARSDRECLWGEPDYEKRYAPDVTFLTGHTPTGFVDPAYKGRIWSGNGHIDLDCGAVFYGSLGCLCLDTMEEIYVK